MLPTQLVSVDESHLNALVADGVRESRSLEFKAKLVWGTESERKEFLADVSALANGGGGDLILGIEEDNGTASKVVGLGVFDPDSDTLKMENVIRLRLQGDSSMNTGMECGENVKARATTRFHWWTLPVTRDAAEAALLPSRSRKPGTGTGHRLAFQNGQGTKGKVCWLRRAATVRGPSPDSERPSLGAASRYFAGRGGQPPGLCRASTRWFRRGPSRGRRRKPEFVGDEGVGGAQHRGEQRGQVEVALAGGGVPGELAEDSRWKSGGRKE